MKGIIWLKRIIIQLPFKIPESVCYLLKSIVYLNYYRRWLINCKYANKYNNRFDLFSRFNVGRINYYEFGVSDGISFTWWVMNNHNKDSRFIGYDTFKGLPERWGVYAKGDMASDIPKLNDERVEFKKGLFQDTFKMVWLNPKLFGSKIVYIDCDLYSSTLFVLYKTNWHAGDIIIFDDFNVMAHVFRAFYDWTDSTKIKCRVIARTKHNSQIAIQIVYEN